MYPQELNRVAYYNAPPYWKKAKQYLEDLTNDLTVAIKRLFPKYEKIIILLNIKAYKKAMYKALKETYKKYWKQDQVAFILIPSSPAWLKHGAIIVSKLIKDFVAGIITTKKTKEGILKMGSDFDKKLLQHARIIDP